MFKDEEPSRYSCCAGCNKKPTGLSLSSDGFELCTGCRSVRFCSVACWRSHRGAHKKACKRVAQERRNFEAALLELELSEDVAEKPTDRPECDLCCHLMPPNAEQSKYYGCCGKLVCRACFTLSTNTFDFASAAAGGSPFHGDNFYEHMMRFNEMAKKACCPFCRSTDDIAPINPSLRERRRKVLEPRAENDDARALLELGGVFMGKDIPRLEIDDNNLQPSDYQDIPKAMKCFEKAGSLGNGDAYYELARLHRKKYNAADFLTCLEKGADLGSMEAHRELAEVATQRQNFSVAMAHYKFLAAAGYSQESIDALTAGYKEGHVSKDDLAISLRSYHLARKELFSTDRAVCNNMASGTNSDGKVVPSNLFM